jgi:hypothetical protein
MVESSRGEGRKGENDEIDLPAGCAGFRLVGLGDEMWWLRFTSRVKRDRDTPTE